MREHLLEFRQVQATWIAEMGSPAATNGRDPKLIVLDLAFHPGVPARDPVVMSVQLNIEAVLCQLTGFFSRHDIDDPVPAERFIVDIEAPGQ